MPPLPAAHRIAGPSVPDDDNFDALDRLAVVNVMATILTARATAGQIGMRLDAMAAAKPEALALATAVVRTVRDGLGNEFAVAADMDRAKLLALHLIETQIANGNVPMTHHSVCRLAMEQLQEARRTVRGVNNIISGPRALEQ